MRRPAPFQAPRRATGTALVPGAVALLALLEACSPRPETATNNEPPTGATQSEAVVAKAKAEAPEADAAESTALVEAEAAKPDDDGAPEAVEPAKAPAEVDPLAPLPDEVRERFASLPHDPKPEALVRNSHYWISNELNQDLWYEHVADQGGAYLGVGTDQNYLLAGWAKADLVVVVDFDASIADLHQVYILFFEESETYEDFYERWAPSSEEDSLALIDERLGDRPDHAQIRKSYEIARQLVWARLRRVRKIYPERDIPTFVSDQAQYDHVRTLARNGRVFAHRGDFTADETMVALGKAMHDSGFTFNVIYLSNVEQYVDYTPGWRRNFIELPVGDKAVVVRTLGWGAFGFAEGEKYHYNVQPAEKFQQWLRTSRVTNLPRMLYYRTKTDTQGLSLLDGEVQSSKRPPEIAE